MERIVPGMFIPRGARLLAALAAVFSGLVAGAWPEQVSAQSYKAEYKLSTAVGPAYPWGKGAEVWAQLVRERTAGRIIIKQFPGASAIAGDAAREFAALRDGTIDLAVGSSSNWAAQVNALNLFALPFMVGDNQALDALLHGEIGATVLRAVEDAGVVPLAWGDNEFREISTAQHALRKPEELAGLRIRVSGSPLLEEVLIALGAVPVRMKWLYAQNALLERGLDGQETTAQVFVVTKAHTLGQKLFTLWSVAADPLVFAVSRAAWDAWTATDREIVRQAAIEAAGREIALVRRATANAEAAMVHEQNATGVIVTRLTPDERAAFAAATSAVFDRWVDRVGVDLVKRAQDAITASRKP